MLLSSYLPVFLIADKFHFYILSPLRIIAHRLES